HTSFSRDWSSDVCSSDLILATATPRPDVSRWIAALLQGMRPAECRGLTWDAVDLDSGSIDVSWQMKPLPYKIPRDRASGFRVPTSEERRVGNAWACDVTP